MKGYITREETKHEEFLRAVLKKWIRTVGGPPALHTWKSLVKCMKSAHLDTHAVETIEDIVCMLTVCYYC